jgi:GDP-4-dehydro-6-deoxy-D-mannose reductase
MVVLPKRLLVTGLSGFVGRHIAALISQEHSAWSLIHADEPLDLLRPDSLQTWCAQQPDAVIHLAGQTFVPQAFKDPNQTLQVNLIGTLNLLQALKANGFNGTFLYVSSGDVYGQVPESALPITEAQPVQARNPYAVSKASAELLCRQWAYAEPWRIVIARPFNHIGAGQSDSFVLASIAKQLARISHGQQENNIQVGDIDVTRDFLDVRDVIGAYFSLLDKGVSGEIYNVCSGLQLRVGDLVQQLIELSELQVSLLQDPALLRRSEQRFVAGDATKLKQATGWQPQIALKETLKAMLQDWLAKV